MIIYINSLTLNSVPLMARSPLQFFHEQLVAVSVRLQVLHQRVLDSHVRHDRIVDKLAVLHFLHHADLVFPDVVNVLPQFQVFVLQLDVFLPPVFDFMLVTLNLLQVRSVRGFHWRELLVGAHLCLRQLQLPDLRA